MSQDQWNMSTDDGESFKQLEELINNVNWPLVTLTQIVKVVTSKNGILKSINTVRKKLF